MAAEHVSLPVGNVAARSKIIDQIKAQVAAIDVKGPIVAAIDQHAKVDVHLKSGTAT